MAQASGTAPWSFVPMSITSTASLVTGLNIFRCTKSGCKMARKCNVLQVLYEDGGWRQLQSNSDSKVAVVKELLKVFAVDFAYNFTFFI